MKNIIPAYPDWRGAIKWSRTHSSGLFAMEISVHNESMEKRPFTAPRSWCSYLLGGDRMRFYREEKSECWIETNPLTDRVEKEREELFESLDWNGGITFFEMKAAIGGSHPGLRTWKVGDDYQHLWDTDKWDWYDFDHVRCNIERIGDAFAESVK